MSKRDKLLLLDDMLLATQKIKQYTKDLDYNIGFLKSVQAKLANEKFVANAKPEMVENEKKKLADAASKIKAIEEQLRSLR